MTESGASYHGSLIRKIRKAQNLSLVELAKKTGLSLSFLSQLERGKTNPSINALRKIANALECPLTTFFTETLSANGPVLRKAERRVLINTESRLTYQLLSRDLNRRIELLHTQLEVGATSAEKAMSHKGDEAALILQGEGRFEVGDKVYDLKEGDSIYILENTPHKFSNIGKCPLIIVGAISPPGF
jgi:transcriptional regulator with XRE-family HTH domain